MQLTGTETQELLEASLLTTAPYWSIPYPRNPFFSGRTTLLQQIHTYLHLEQEGSGSRTYALSGVGGIGKTQIAIEYAYHAMYDYIALFWLAADTYSTITSSFTQIAQQLPLDLARSASQEQIVAAFIRWLNTQRDWLLIVDNVNDLEMVKAFLPTTCKGAILFTMRMQAIGVLAYRHEVEPMSMEEGTHFLLRRAKLQGSARSPHQLAASETASARTIVEAMDGLPLALDQAGAYIEETGCSITDYLDIYRLSHTTLLKRRGTAVYDHPDSLVTTLSFAFAQIELLSPSAMNILSLCAFLHPDALPEYVLAEGAPALSPLLRVPLEDRLQLEEALAILRRYSIMQRNTQMKTLTLHRLVQVCLQHYLPQETWPLWIEHSMRLIEHCFPRGHTHVPDPESWDRCEHLLPHALAVLTWSEHVHCSQAVTCSLLIKVGIYIKANV